jgi:hypothetical protein
MERGQGDELADHLVVPSEVQPGLDQVGRHLKPVLLEPSDQRVARQRGHVGQRFAAPQRERRRVLPLGRRPTALGPGPFAGLPPLRENPQVQLARFDVHQISGRDGADPLAALAERPPQPHDLVVERRRGRRGLLAVPQVVGEPVLGDDGVGVQQQGGEEGATQCPAYLQDTAVAALRMDRPEQ